MPFKFSNSATATLASSITSGATSIAVASGLGALFPGLTAGETFTGVLVDSSNNVEIVRVTARTGDVMTVDRAQEGTTARAFSSGSRFEMRLTSAALNNFLQLDGAQTVTGQKTFTQTIVGNLQGNVTGNLTGNVTGNLTGNVTGNLTGNVTGNVSGNAGTVTNGVYTTGDQVISGAKNFLSTSVRLGGTAIGLNEVYVYESSANAFAVRTGSAGSGYKYFGLAASGDMTVQGAVIASGDMISYSDERLKENWRELPANFVERLAQVKMGVYDRKDTGETQAGVGAQSLYGLLPQAVREDSAGFLSVAYGNAALVSAIELAREVVSLRRELNELKGA